MSDINDCPDGSINNDDVCEETYDDSPELIDDGVDFNPDEFFKDVIEFGLDTDEEPKKTLAYPSVSTDEAIKLAEDIAGMEESAALTKFTTKQILATGAAINSAERHGQAGDILAKLASFNKWRIANDVRKNVNYGIRNPKELKKKKGVVTGESALVSFNAMLGLGGVTQIPLYHSGFWLILDMISEADAISLEVKLGKNIIDLGRKTSGTVFSNDDVIYNEIIIDFIIEHLIGSSVAVDSVYDLKNMISIHDMPVIILGLVDAITPKGIDVMMTCNHVLDDKDIYNTSDEDTDDVISSTIVDGESGIDDIDGDDLVDDEDDRVVVGNTRCDFVFTANLDPKKLLWINNDVLTKEELIHMSKRSKNAVTVDEVEYYKRNLKITLPKDYTIRVNNDNVFVLKLSIPTLDKHIEQGSQWIENVITTVDDIIGDDGDEETRLIKIREVSKATLLNTYVHYIEEIRYDGKIVKDFDTISMYLDSMSRLDVTYTQVVDAIKEYIRDSTLALVGTPSYVCPRCSKSSDGPTKDFKEIIPLNITSSFLDLSTLKKQRLAERTGFTL